MTVTESTLYQTIDILQDVIIKIAEINPGLTLWAKVMIEELAELKSNINTP